MNLLRTIFTATVLGLLACGSGLEGPDEVTGKGDGEEATLRCDPVRALVLKNARQPPIFRE